MSNYDPRSVLATSPMTRLQITACIVTVLLNALDGFDVLAISFATPGILKEWSIDRGTFGVVLSMELWGMAVGSFVLGGVADQIGRRRSILIFLVVMTLGSFMCSRADDLTDLRIWRFFTGLGIGGMLAAINAASAEFSNDRMRNFWVALMTIGYPLGNVFCALFVSELLKTHSWRAVFEFAATLSAALIPVVWFLVPESVSWLCRKQPAGALEKVNASLKKMGRAAITALPVLPPLDQRPSFRDLFTPQLLRLTILMVAAYFAHITSFYYIIKWVAPIASDMGYSGPVVADVLLWVSIGGATGGALLGVLALRWNIRFLTVGVLLLSAMTITIFGRGQDDLVELKTIVFWSGFFVNAGIVGLYTLLAIAFPTHLRATGTGIAIGAGRGGAALAPIIAGYLFKNGMGLQMVSIIMASGALIGAIALLFVRYANTSEAKLGGGVREGMSG
ncbi:MAG TPA: MFS transporter [Steroidobacteraceae bacterium]|jgi:benzoate transport|nr:MFS transporter [Steroidobacteraceae bacterium]